VFILILDAGCWMLGAGCWMLEFVTPSAHFEKVAEIVFPLKKTLTFLEPLKMLSFREKLIFTRNPLLPVSDKEFSIC
jgi:hypothetical protein